MKALTDNSLPNNTPLQLSLLSQPSYVEEDGSLNLLLIRKQLFGLKQKAFANLLGISTNTYRSWEYKERNPSGPSLSLLRIAISRPEVVKEILGKFVNHTDESTTMEEYML